MINVRRAALATLAGSLLLAGGRPAGSAAHPEHSVPAGPRYAPKVHWHTLAEGLEEAARERKPLVVDFAVPENCSRCEFLQNNVYNRDAIVDRINADFIPVWVDLTGELTAEEKALGEKFDYRNDCLLLFLNHRGEVIRDPEGRDLCFADKVEPEAFIEYLDHARKTYVPVR